MISDSLMVEVKELCDYICNSYPHQTISGKIQSMALSIGHHPQVLNAKNHTRLLTRKKDNMRKIIQISTSQSTEDIDRIALCDDGTCWEYQFAKPIYKDIPANESKPYSSREKVGMTDATWVMLAGIPQDNILMKESSGDQS